MSNQLFDAYFTAPAMRAIFCDAGRVQGMLDFEAALARAEARVGLIPPEAVAPIAAACRAELYDFAALAQAIATALTQSYNIPPENLTTQGYGEQYLKVQTQGPSAENRRVTLRRVTDLLNQQNTQAPQQ